jgi:hypothetical protein
MMLVQVASLVRIARKRFLNPLQVATTKIVRKKSLCSKDFC